MNSVLYLAWRYLSFNRWKTAVLVTAITVIIFLPLALELVLERSSEQLTARAASTPLLLGAPGSPLELVRLPFPDDVRVVLCVLRFGLGRRFPYPLRSS